MTSYDQHYYDGAWQPSSDAETIAVISSATEEVVGRVPRGTAADVDRAVKAARARPSSPGAACRSRSARSGSRSSPRR